MTRIFDWLCFRVWLLIPLRFDNTRLWYWLLQYAGRYAHSEPRPAHWGPKMRALWDYLKATGGRIGGVTWGPNAGGVEDRADAILCTLKSAARGDLEELCSECFNGMDSAKHDECDKARALRRRPTPTAGEG